MQRCPVSALLAMALAAPMVAQKVPDARVNTDPPAAAPSDAPQIAASGSSVYVVWEDQRTRFDDIFINRSTDGGASWLGSDRRLDTGVPAGTASSAVGLNLNFQAWILDAGAALGLSHTNAV